MCLKTQTFPLIPAIQWHEGMLLAPHHLQQLDLRYHQALSYHTQLLSPFHWGIINYTLDQVLLASGVVRLLTCEAILPDGTLVNYNADQHPRVEVDLTPNKAFLATENWYVYVGVHQAASHGQRYFSWEGEEVADMHVVDNVIRIPRLLPRLELIASQHPPASFCGFPLLKVTCPEEAYVTLPFTPPCFHVDSASPLGQRCGAFVRRIREKASVLSEKWQNQVGSALMHETAHLLRPLIQLLPLLEGLLQSEKLHPYQIYQLLCQASGNIAALRLGQLPPVTPAYNHDDILETFTPLLDQTESVIKSLEQEYFIQIFQKEGRFFFLPIPPELLKSDALLLGVRAPQRLTETELEDWIMGAVIASDSALEGVKSMRITGASRRILIGGELAALLPGRGCSMVRVELDADFIKVDENLNIFNMGDEEEKRPVDIALYTKTMSKE